MNNNVLIQVYSTGRVRLALSLVGTSVCTLDMGKFPFDKQLCQLTIMAHNQNTNEILLSIVEDGELEQETVLVFLS